MLLFRIFWVNICYCPFGVTRDWCKITYFFAFRRFRRCKRAHVGGNKMFIACWRGCDACYDVCVTSNYAGGLVSTHRTGTVPYDAYKKLQQDNQYLQKKF